jgi:uncharacterized protein (DUF983 family)
MATQATVARGFDVACPRCFGRGNVYAEVGDTDNLWCRECDDSFTATQMRALVEEWGPLLRWLEAAPRREG